MERAEGFRGSLLALAAAGGLLLQPAPALAGMDTCFAPVPGPEAVGAAFDLASRLTAAAEQDEVEVALVARVGQDLSRFGVRYSHLGFLVRSGPDAPWRVLHEYNPCGPDAGKPELFMTGPASFFMDSPRRLEAALVIPSRPLQAALRTILAGDAPRRLMGQHYNFLAHPLSTTDQNCTQWVAELLAAAMALQRDGLLPQGRDEARGLLQQAGMESSRFDSTFGLRWQARLFGGVNASLDDQPDAYRLTITTADDVIRFLVAQDRAKLLDLPPPSSRGSMPAP